MITIKGKGVCGGIAFGKLELITKSTSRIVKTTVQDTEKEIERFFKAKDEASNNLKELYEKAINEVGEENAMIFDIHKMMLDDKDYIDSIVANIKTQKMNAECAVAQTSDNFSEMFASMQDSYMRARAADVKDISERIISILTNSEDTVVKSSGNVIIGAIDLAPSETVQLPKDKIFAFVTEEGSFNSHTSILARTMNIPAVISANGITNPENDGKDVIVDGFTGSVYINPDMHTVLIMQKKKLETDEKKELLLKLKGTEPITKDGQKIKLYANIGSLQDMSLVYENDAMGVGLFRSEFIYLESKTYPTEDEQFAIYKNVAQKALGKKVIIRTLDIGADKKVDYFEMPEEENPALGVRAIRICIQRPQIFKTQLRAILRASAFGNISIMFPMITSLDEIVTIKAMVSEVKEELLESKIQFDDGIELGIMIETPASAIISDILSKEVDFFSIGTNDLTQYTLAADRQNIEVAPFCDTHHKALLRLIKTVVDNAHKEGIWAGVCGELASDTTLTEFFLAIGIDELSVSPGLILPLKEKILNTDVSKIKTKSLKMLI